CMQPLEFPWSF
nr:immunoglobulin light chain junction region [Macaca mulatta]